MSFDAARAPGGLREQSCTWCAETKPVGEFWRNESGWITRECRTCAADRLQCWQAVEKDPVPPRRPVPVDEEGDVRCGKCGRSRPRSLFHTYRSSRGSRRYLRRNCKQCAGAMLAAYKVKHNAQPAQRAASRARWLLKTYGITADQYDDLLAAQGGRCAVCRTTDPGGPTPDAAFHVDHHHASGAVRGLLCRSCNTALGLLAEDLTRIEALVTYLTTHAAVTP